MNTMTVHQGETMMQTHELDAYLGHAYGEVTDEQRERMLAAAEAIADRYESADDAEAERGAFSTAVAVILDDASLEGVAVDYHLANRAVLEAHAALTGAIIATDATVTEVASRAGVSRPLVYKARSR